MSTKLADAISALADLYEYGQLVASSSPVEFVDTVREDVVRLRAEIVAISTRLYDLRHKLDDVRPDGKTILDFFNVWLDQERDIAESMRAEIARLRAALAACGRLCAEVQDWADRLADGDDLTLDECLEYSSRCERIAQAWLPPPTPEEQAAIDEVFRKDMEKKAPAPGKEKSE